MTTRTGRSIRVQVDQVRAIPRLQTDADPIEARVLGLIEFDAKFGDLAIQTRAPTAIHAGMIRLPRGAVLRRYVASTSQLSAEVEIADGVRLRDLLVPCRAVEPVARDSIAIPRSLAVPAGVYVVARDETLTLRHAPTRGALSVDVRTADAHRFRYRVVARRADWLHVRWTGADGARLDGWVERPAVRDEFLQVGVSALGVARAAATLFGLCMHGSSHTWHGTATVLGDTPVHVSNDGESWARVPRTARFTVQWHYGSDWVELNPIRGLSVPGDCDSTEPGAWVRRSRVRLPATVAAMGGSGAGP